MRYVLAILLTCSAVIAAPAITTITGTLDNGEQITITGTGFGSAPEHIVVWHDYENGTAGNDVLAADPTIGSYGGLCWDETQPPTHTVDCYVPQYTAADSVSGTQSYEYRRTAASSNGHSAPYVDIPNTSEREVYLYGWVKPKTGSDLCAGSNNWVWKFNWILGGGASPTIDNDRYTPVVNCSSGTPPGLDSQRSGSNSNSESPSLSAGFQVNAWYNMQMYYYAGSGAPWTDGIIWAGGIDNGGTYANWLNVTGTYFDGDASDPDGGFDGWGPFNLLAGHVNSSQPTAQAYVDDQYVQAGDNARSRVMIFDTGNKNNAAKVSICTLGAGGDSWADTSITCTLREGPFSGSDSVYFSVYTNDGTFSGNTLAGTWAGTAAAERKSESGASMSGASRR